VRNFYIEFMDGIHGSFTATNSYDLEKAGNFVNQFTMSAASYKWSTLFSCMIYNSVYVNVAYFSAISV
jgi:hypothetical protein